MCTYFAHYMVTEERINDKEQEAVRLEKYFGFKRPLLLRAEHVQYYALVKRVPRLTTLKRVLDETVLAALFDKTKNMQDRRPDYFHFYPPTNMALHGEFDEDSKHEDDHDRLREIAHHAGCGWERTYYFRIMAHIDKPERALFTKKTNENGKYYAMTKRGFAVLDEVAAYVEECLDNMEANVMPPKEESGDLPIKWFNK